mmetsp:Transcript_8454/g.14500  ORF Transcript_8454/g.14500 Transcript_8454/m.14500 type:complete len:236 (-) Transcript_8454:131-838(-)
MSDGSHVTQPHTSHKPSHLPKTSHTRTLMEHKQITRHTPHTLYTHGGAEPHHTSHMSHIHTHGRAEPIEAPHSRELGQRVIAVVDRAHAGCGLEIGREESAIEGARALTGQYAAEGRNRARINGVAGHASSLDAAHNHIERHDAADDEHGTGCCQHPSLLGVGLPLMCLVEHPTGLVHGKEAQPIAQHLHQTGQAKAPVQSCQADGPCHAHDAWASTHRHCHLRAYGIQRVTDHT